MKRRNLSQQLQKTEQTKPSDSVLSVKKAEKSSGKEKEEEENTKSGKEQGSEEESKSQDTPKKDTSNLKNKLSMSELKISNKILGRGNFATVVKGTWGGKKVAIKKFLPNKVKGPEFEQEITHLSNLEHRDIVQYYGYIDENQQKYIIMEYVNGGSLFDFIHGNNEAKLTLEHKYKIVVDVASGMEFLHRSGIGHRDLNTKNLLIDKNTFKVKLADLGLSQEIKGNVSKDKRVGTLRWMAPEVLKKKCTSIEKADIWSYGIILLEIGTTSLPYIGKVESDVKYALNRIQPPEVPKEPKLPSFWHDIMGDCWSRDPLKRPSFTTILQILKKNKTNL